MKKYVKPSGVEVEVHPDSEAYAESLGWKKKEAKPEAKEPVKQTPKKGK